MIGTMGTMGTKSYKHICLFILIMAFIISVPVSSLHAARGRILLSEPDGSPDKKPIYEIEVPNGTLSESGGVGSLDFGVEQINTASIVANTVLGSTEALSKDVQILTPNADLDVTLQAVASSTGKKVRIFNGAASGSGFDLSIKTALGVLVATASPQEWVTVCSDGSDWFEDQGVATDSSGNRMFGGTVSVIGATPVLSVGDSASRLWDAKIGTWGGATFPVPYFRNHNAGGIAFDLMPNGDPANVWMDICSTDVSADSDNWEALGLTKTTTYASVSTKAQGTGTVRDLVLQQYGGDLIIGGRTSAIAAFMEIVNPDVKTETTLRWIQFLGSNEAEGPFGLGIGIEGAALAANRIMRLQTSEWGSGSSGNLSLQHAAGNLLLGNASGYSVFAGNVGIGIGANTPELQLQIAVPYAATDTTQRWATIIGSNEATNPFGLAIGPKGAATRAARSMTLQTTDWESASGGILALQPSAGNVSIGTATFGASSQGVLAVGTGTAPDGNSVDSFQMYSADIIAGNAAPTFRTEAGHIVKLYTQSNIGSPSGGGTQDAEARTAIGSILTLLQTNGLMAAP